MQETGDRNVDIFDREVKRKHRDRAALIGSLQDPLLDHVTDSLLDRLEDIKRDFPVALSLGGAGDSVRRHLRGRGNIQTLYQMDLSQAMLDRSAEALNAPIPPETLFNPTMEAPSTSNPSEPRSLDSDASEVPSTSGRPEIQYVVGDEELLPFREESLDLVVSSLGLHWVNDLPGAMIQARRALKPDGLFLAAMFGGETLKELRIACSVAELEREGGVSPRVSPLVQVRDAGNLLGRANLALPAVDVDTFTVNYPSALELVEHLRSMGEVNAVRNRRLVLPRDTALATAAAYQSMFANKDGSVPATFQVIYMAGWAPHSTQQRPRQRGSATVSLEDLAQVVEWRPEGNDPK
ncbi:S-adenosyl-L-methionine dependent methyltransferases [Klebsormidium nitens]|uniref:S-adenosyl-L-methionine dependent methyltransferases n=1 Tax=Klebsormidium nitens TaxID=105231 RepID=A0A0U9HI35_KLENI|nr:S-adenosyl-L-methionine dependent methyltransferases [Klebsormidium nitens]|eukprot:GAQ79426.1 S-adenosyl-L-methionine dependent methyltransferases [Klebsormidium nitens]